MSVQRYLFYITQNYSFAILRPVQKVILEQGNQVAWFVAQDSVNLDYFEDGERRLETIDDIFDFNPQAVLHPADIAPTFLPGINVSVFHGFNSGKLDKRGRNDHFKVRNCFDLYCTQGPNTTTEFKALQQQHPHFQVRETGWCMLDPLFAKQAPISDGKNSPADKDKRKTILMCSTFSKRLTAAPILFETIKTLCQKDQWRWLIQFHPKMDKDIVAQYKSIQNDNLTFVETADVLPLLKEADVMVCDTSSVLIMFLLLNKPVVTFNNISPKDYMLDIDSADLLEQTIYTALGRPEKLMAHIQEFIEQTHPYQDGKSSQRLLQAIDEVCSKDDPKKKKPFDFFRQLKIRKRLNYWKFRL